MKEKLLQYRTPFVLESGEILPELTIAYFTYGQLNPEKDNVIWICHALTANADAADWWEGLVGKGKPYDPDHYFIVCANMLGSCYGSSGPAFINPQTGELYGDQFPLITIKDMVKAHQLLQKELGIQKIKLLTGGSMGGQQALEWAITDPDLFEKICILASNAKHSPWGIAFNEAQRMAIFADPSLDRKDPKSGQKGLEAARAIAMLSYRHYKTYSQTQAEEHDDKIQSFRASSYQQYQGLKLYQRFNVFSYISLSRSMDSHNVGRHRGGIENALKKIKAQALIIGITTDILFPIEEQILLAKHIPNASLEVITSSYGHDGFLVEFESIGGLVKPFLTESVVINNKKNTVNDSLVTNPVALPGTEEF
ncbi:MAG: homoserine O-acetyltransferase [Saprospiraceae bacterium]